MQMGHGKYEGRKRTFQFMATFVLMLFATSAYSASKTVLVVGDSLSAEYGISRGAGWVSLLGKKINAKNIDATVVNASISGETTSGGRARLPALLKQHDPDVVVIELGGNDGLRGLPLTAAQSNLQKMIGMAKESNARVLLVGMQIPPNYGRNYAEKFSTMYANLAQKMNVPLVPFLLQGVAEQPELFQADRIHPRASAQPLMLDNIWTHLKPLLER
jgi:acyl-CoA thioesterase-1